MRYLGSKNKVARRQGADLGLKTLGSKSYARLLKKINVIPGQHGQTRRRRRKLTEYASQLKEKQKLRFMFGLSEKQMKNYFKKSVKKTGNTASHMISFLEKRLDNIVYRLGFAPTRTSARQLVSHRHIKVNGNVVNIASYQVSVGDKISFAKESTKEIPYIRDCLDNKDMFTVGWLERKKMAGRLISEPTVEFVEKQINLRLIIEFYSR